MQSERWRHEERAFILKASVERNSYAGQMLQQGCWDPRSFMMRLWRIGGVQVGAKKEVKKIVSSSGTESGDLSQQNKCYLLNWAFSANIIHISTFTFNFLPDTGHTIAFHLLLCLTQSICLLLAHKVTLVTDQRSGFDGVWKGSSLLFFTFLVYWIWHASQHGSMQILWQLQDEIWNIVTNGELVADGTKIIRTKQKAEQAFE